MFTYFFFQRTQQVSDDKIRLLVAKTLDTHNPREWYFALMDYGAKLAKEVKNPNRKSRHYRIQSKFEGSLRQVRGAILKALLKDGSMSVDALLLSLRGSSRRSLATLGTGSAISGAHEIAALPAVARHDIEKALAALIQEGFIQQHGDNYELSSL